MKLNVKAPEIILFSSEGFDEPFGRIAMGARKSAKSGDEDTKSLSLWWRGYLPLLKISIYGFSLMAQSNVPRQFATRLDTLITIRIVSWYTRAIR